MELKAAPLSRVSALLRLEKSLLLSRHSDAFVRQSNMHRAMAKDQSQNLLMPAMSPCPTLTSLIGSLHITIVFPSDLQRNLSLLSPHPRPYYLTLTAAASLPRTPQPTIQRPLSSPCPRRIVILDYRYKPLNLRIHNLCTTASLYEELCIRAREVNCTCNRECTATHPRPHDAA